MDTANSIENMAAIAAAAYEIYRKYYLRSVLLEIFGTHAPLDDNEITAHLFAEIRKEDGIFNSTTMSDVKAEYMYLVSVGYLSAIEEEKKVTVSDYGVKALQEGVLQNLASTAFFGYQSLTLSSQSLSVSSDGVAISKNALLYAKVAAAGTIAALLLSVISICITLYR